MAENEENKIKSLEQEIERLKKLDGQRSDIISLNVHQLRTFLSASKWILKMFLDGDLGHLETEQKNLIQKCADDNEQMIALVNELLEANKKADINIEYNFKNVELTKLVEDVLFDFTGEAKKKGVETIFLKPEEEMPQVKADQGKIKAVLQNLIDNAIKYSSQGGNVFVSLQKEPDKITIAVKDNGLGVSDADKDKIFEKFFRVNDGAASASGTGLGLFTSQKIIEKHGGKMWFESKLNQGSTFYFTLPLAK